MLTLSTPNHTFQKIAEIRAQYELLLELRAANEISDSAFHARAEGLQQLASDEYNIDLEKTQLKAIESVEKFDWIGSAFYVISALLVLALLGPLLSKLLKPLARLFNAFLFFLQNNAFLVRLAHTIMALVKRMWEVFAYALLVFSLYKLAHEYIVLLVSSLLGSLIAFSILSRQRHGNQELFFKITLWTLTFVWGGIAWHFNNRFVGFITVTAFISSIGFIMVLAPQMIAIGFRQHSSKFIMRLTGMTFVLTLVTWILFYTDYVPALKPAKELMQVFRAGMSSLIPLVYFVGLGYIAFFLDYQNRSLKIFSELLAFVSGAFVLGVALVYGIGSMFWIGFFFMTWNAVDKYYEYIYKRTEFVWAGLILAAILGIAGYLVKSTMGIILEALEPLHL